MAEQMLLPVEREGGGEKGRVDSMVQRMKVKLLTRSGQQSIREEKRKNSY